jgi:nicotinamide-nucleotide amidase
VDAPPAAVFAARLSQLLEQTQTQIVFAESCTGGLVAASLAGCPGISRWLCGSAVTYQEQTKVDWLAVRQVDLDDYTAVSPQVTQAMALAVLRNTSAADLAVAVTGHLGPQAPPELDGVIFIATQWRRSSAAAPHVERIALASRGRCARQMEAANWVLQVSAESVVKKEK